MALQYNSSGDYIGLSGWQTPTPAPQRPATSQTAAPQMTPPMAANLTRNIIGGSFMTSAPTPTPDPNMITGNNIPKVYGGGTPSYQGTNNVIPVPSAYPMVNWTPQLSTEQAAARVAEQKARDQQTSWSNGIANNSMNQQYNTPPMSTQFQPTPAPVTAAPAIPQRTEQYYTDYVNKQIAASLGITRSAADQAEAAGQTAATQQLGSIQTQYDRNQANLKEDRTLENAHDAAVSNPFSGTDQGRISLRDFARARTDRESSQDLLSKQNNVNQNLTDLKNSIEAKQKALVDASPAEAEKLKMSLMNDERNYDLNLRAADEKATQDYFNRQSDTFRNNLAAQNQNAILTGKNADGTPTASQSNADRTYNYNVGRDSVGDARNATNDAANYTNYYNPSGMNATQINKEIAQNSAAYANASPEQRQQLHNQNVYLNGLLGKTDSTGNGDYTGGNPNGIVGYRTGVGQQQDFNEGLKNKEFDYTQARDLIKDTQYKQKFDEDVRQFDVKTALDNAYKQGQLTQEQYNGATQRMSVNNSSKSQGITNQKYQNEQVGRQVESEVYGHSQEFKTAQDVNDYFKANGAYLASKLGASDLDKLQKSFLAPFNADTKTDNSVYDKALSAAQKDPTWLLPSTDKKALIKEYQDLISSR